MSERRPHLILVALILLALLGSATLILPQSPWGKEPTLGLDLQGGLEVTLQAAPPPGEELTDEDMDRSVEIMRDRVDRLGVAEPEIRKQAGNQIVIELPGIKNPEQAADVIGRTAQLELYDLQTSLAGPSLSGPELAPVPEDNLFDLLAAGGTQSLVREDEEGAGPYYLFRAQGKQLVAGPLPTREALLDTDAAQALEGERGDSGVPSGYRVFAVPAKTVVVTCSRTAAVCPGVGTPTRTFYYLFKHDLDAEQPKPEMTGQHLELSGTRQDFDPQTGQPVVLMQFTDEGADEFHRITREEAARGLRQYNLAGRAGDPQLFNQNFAIVLDREIRSFPSIDFQQYPDGISGSNGAQITGIGSVTEAKNLATVLQTGALPVEFRTLSQTQISATLGEDSLRQALIAGIVGLMLTALFLLLLYRFLGAVAVIALGIYSVFLYAATLLFGVTLTLPGFAGIILTIGVAADANIVIFERIKEEYRAGKSVRAAIAAGYAKGFHTIVDANVVTAITALVLFTLATAGVKGFALMLLVGILISMVTAVFATRAMLGLLAGFRWFDSPRFMGASGQQRAKWLEIDFVGKRRIWLAVSGAFVLIGLGTLAFQGLNLGIDFRGGTAVSFETEEPRTISEVRGVASRVVPADSQVQGRGERVGSDRYTEFQIRTEPLEQAQQTSLTNQIERSFDAEASVTTVSGSFGRQIAESALLAILISFLLIVGYISFRFHWKFSVPVIVAMLHDVFITIGVYSLTGRQVTTSTVAAVLTVLGYSVYDTIIIFDRVRENIPLMRRASFPTITNVSLWETIRRSLATTISTLLPVGALFFFGGETLKDFAFALLVGIAAGAYSSIFVAAPFLSWLKEREPEFIRRGDGAADKQSATVAIEEATAAAADQPVPALSPLTPSERTAANEAKRERRRQRRKARPHGRAR